MQPQSRVLVLLFIEARLCHLPGQCMHRGLLLLILFEEQSVLLLVTGDQAGIALNLRGCASLTLLMGPQEVFLPFDGACPAVERVVYLSL